MANEKLAALVNNFGSSVMSVGREVGVNVTLDKAKVSPGVKVANVSVAALIGIVGEGARVKVVIMLDQAGFESAVSAMTGGMIAANAEDAMSMSVIGELSNMIGGRALAQSALAGVDVTPPQMITGDNISGIPLEGAGIRSFTLPFTMQPAGTLYLVLAFEDA